MAGKKFQEPDLDGTLARVGQVALERVQGLALVEPSTTGTAGCLSGRPALLSHSLNERLVN